MHIHKLPVICCLDCLDFDRLLLQRLEEEGPLVSFVDGSVSTGGWNTSTELPQI